MKIVVSVVLGGSKVSDKLAVIEAPAAKVDKLLVGGGTTARLRFTAIRSSTERMGAEWTDASRNTAALHVGPDRRSDEHPRSNPAIGRATADPNTANAREDQQLGNSTKIIGIVKDRGWPGLWPADVIGWRVQQDRSMT